MSQQPSVLIVDDDEIFLNITESMINAIGFPVLKAKDGIEAISVFQQYSDDIGCVVLDLQMPRMGGIATFQRLKKMHEEIKVIVASGYLMDSNRDQLASLQPVGFLEKPLSYKELSELLLGCCNN